VLTNSLPHRGLGRGPGSTGAFAARFRGFGAVRVGGEELRESGVVNAGELDLGAPGAGDDRGGQPGVLAGDDVGPTGQLALELRLLVSGEVGAVGDPRG